MNDEVKPKRRLGRILAALVSLAVLFLALGVYLYFDSPLEQTDRVIRFKIPPGVTLTETAQRLEQQKLVRSAVLFRILYEVLGNARAFPSGVFDIPQGLSAGHLVAYFQSVKPLTARITIPEGTSSLQIAKMLKAAKVLTSTTTFLQELTDPALLAQFHLKLPTLDGLLFPDTYLFNYDEDPQVIITRMVNRFRDKTKSFMDWSQPSFEKNLILASIVEREYRVPEEAPIIASVFLNRLQKRIRLASCATIEYILTDIEGRPHPDRIYFVDTKIPSPYNTYLHYGLPPTVICNPGLVALKAAVFPAKTNYLYFVVDNEAKGTHNFTSSWRQHEKAREAYLESYVSKG